MSRSIRVALVCFVAVALLAIALPALRSLDDAVARGIQATRDCASDANAERLGTIAALMLTIGAAIVLRRPPPFAVMLLAIATFATGALFGELLKTAFERLRPDSMPGSPTGNAFPSGHIMNTTLAAAILWIHARPGRRARLELGVLGVLLVAAVVVQSLSRLWLGAHWASDVPASVLLALGWVALVPTLVSLGPLRVAIVGTVSASAALLFLRAPELRPRLATALDANRPIAEVLIGPPVKPLLEGDWELGHREPIGDVAWLRGTEGTITLPPVAEPPRTVRLGIRPTTLGRERRAACLAVSVGVNEWTAPPTALVTGWREIRLAPPADAWRAEGNVVRLRVLADDETRNERADYGLVGVVSLRLTD